MKKNRLKLFPLIALLFSVVSCDLVPSDFLSSLNQLISRIPFVSYENSIISGSTSVEQEEIEKSNYIYTIEDKGINLIKYNGEYTALIDIPEIIDGKKVVSIMKGCFVRDNKVARSVKRANSSDDVDNEKTDISTYVISSNIETIEDGAFEENSTFLTDSATKPNGWKESSMQGSGKEGTGNVYYDTLDKDTIVSKGIVYLKNKQRGGIIVARCLTQRKQVEIPSLVDGEKVVDIGNGAFSYNDKIEKVTLPSTIGEVFRNAFSYCSNLKEIVFESSNLSRLMTNSFEGCTSLQVVKLPENCTYLAPRAFGECGNIEKIYMPFSMVHIAENAFYNTTIGELNYSGTEEQFKKIKLGADVAELLSNTKIIYATEQKKVVLNHLDEINDYEDNTFVEFEGIITGYYNQKGVYVTDPETKFSIWCFNSNELPFYDVEYVGRKVKVKGDKIHYIGQLEVAHAEIELVGEEKFVVEPIEIDLADKNINYEEYLGYYVVVRGTVSEVLNKSIYLEGSDIYLYAFYHWPGSLTVYPGTTIEVTGWVHIYNQIYEVMYDSRLMQIL